MTNKERIMIKATRLGFVSKDKLVSVNDEYYPMWLFEINRWMAINYGINILVECVNPSGFYISINSPNFTDEELDYDVFEEDIIDSYDECYEQGILCALDELRNQLRKKS